MRTRAQRAIHRYIFEDGGWTPGVRSVSCFRAAVRDARQLTGRNVDTGTVRRRLRSGRALWPGTLVYLVLLDQVGQVISPRPRKPAREPFLMALEEFGPPSLSERDREMLYALRCAFAHEYALANEGPQTGPRATSGIRRHLFALAEAHGSTDLVHYPSRGRWNGRYDKRMNWKTGTTEVNIVALADLVEEVVARIERMANANELHLVKGVTPTMVLRRWGFREVDHTA